MTTALQTVGIKSLAVRVLREMATRRAVRDICPTPTGCVGQEKGQGTGALKVPPQGLAPCGPPHCAGCYDVGDGKKIHPPKPDPEWLEKWKPKGSVQ